MWLKELQFPSLTQCRRYIYCTMCKCDKSVFWVHLNKNKTPKQTLLWCTFRCCVQVASGSEWCGKWEQSNAQRVQFMGRYLARLCLCWAERTTSGLGAGCTQTPARFPLRGTSLAAHQNKLKSQRHPRLHGRVGVEVQDSHWWKTSIPLIMVATIVICIVYNWPIDCDGTVPIFNLMSGCSVNDNKTGNSHNVSLSEWGSKDAAVYRVFWRIMSYESTSPRMTLGNINIISYFLHVIDFYRHHPSLQQQPWCLQLNDFKCKKMGKYHYYVPVTWTLEHVPFQLLQQLNPKSSFTSLWLRFFFFFRCKKVAKHQVHLVHIVCKIASLLQDFSSLTWWTPQYGACCFEIHVVCHYLEKNHWNGMDDSSPFHVFRWCRFPFAWYLTVLSVSFPVLFWTILGNFTRRMNKPDDMTNE